MNAQPNNPLHGISLKKILETLVEKYTWEELSGMIKIKCFTDRPSIKSSLTFLRKTQWAREKVEELYLDSTEQEGLPVPSNHSDDASSFDDFKFE
ncbi:DUF2132 domain-containing protein [Candidatus Uhrbacteria bacterium]|nr:DUF2132 domain-containing protein [Candidatus Uhrbacteria bacterium]